MTETVADKPTVLFVCVHNAGRSQMAAGYLQHLAGDRIEVLSAGSKPGNEINPVAVAAMAEEGIDIAGNQPKVLTTEAVQASYVVITMGCGDDCAVALHQDVRDWPVGDPAEADWERLQEIVAEIEDRVDAFWREVSGGR